MLLLAGSPLPGRDRARVAPGPSPGARSPPPDTGCTAGKPHGTRHLFDRLALETADLVGHVDTWQLVVNTATPIVTVLPVALLQNAPRRSDHAVHAKLDVHADGLANLMEQTAPDDANLQQDMRDLRAAVVLERSPADGPLRPPPS